MRSAEEFYNENGNLISKEQYCPVCNNLVCWIAHGDASVFCVNCRTVFNIDTLEIYFKNAIDRLQEYREHLGIQ